MLTILCDIFLVVYCGKCPKPEVVKPCYCASDQSIFCEGEEYYSIRNIFKRVSHSLNDSEKHFNFFLLDNPAITELEENIFYDITFERISLVNVAKIHKKAFNSTFNTLRDFTCSKCPKMELNN